jgi:membrane protease YdiL (CAAX protease family)
VREPSPDDVPLIAPPAFHVALVGLVSVALLFVTLGATAQALHLAWGVWFSEAFVFLAVPVVALQVTGRKPMRFFGTDQPPVRGLAAGFAVGLFNYAAWAVPLMWVAEHAFPKAIVDRFSAARLFERQTTLELVVLVAGVSIAAPICEEALYRGLLQAGLAPRLGWPRAVVVTALVFTVMHFDPVGLLARFELGVVFGLLAWRAGSLWPAIGAHAANNLVSCVVYFASGGQDSEVAWSIVAGLFLGGNVALVLTVKALWNSTAWRAPVPASDELAAFMPMTRAVAPWLVAGFLAIGLLAAVDLPGAQVNVIDLMHPVSAPKPEASPGERAAWEELQSLRSRARRGEGDLGEYRTMRQLAAERPRE